MRSEILFKKVLEYSKFSAIFILLKSNSYSQVIYTDIDPDMVLDSSPEGVWFDIDANGSYDIGLQNYSFTTYSFSKQETFTFKFLLAFRYNSANAIVGQIDGDGTCYPSALTNGYLIKPSLNWQTQLTQILATNRYHSGVSIGNCTYCGWNNDSIIETIDHYLGIRFIDDFGFNHYGWLRCDVVEDGRTLIVKDYAYEAVANSPIIAGDTIHYLDILENTDFTFCSLANNGNTINLVLSESINAAMLYIYNINGQLALSRDLNSGITSFVFSEVGIFLVVVESQLGRYSKTINTF